MHHLVDALANAVSSDNTQVRVVLTIVFLALNLAADQLEQTLLLVLLFSRREEHVCEVAWEHFNVVSAEILDGILLRHANCSNRWMREDHCGNVVVVHLKVRAIVEDAFNEAASSPDSNRRQSDIVCHVSDCVNAWHSRVLELIDDDGSLGDLNSGVLESKRLNVGWSAHSDEALVASNRLA